MEMEIMNKKHSRWEEFIALLEGPDGCNFKEKIPGDENPMTWNCGGGHDKTLAKTILEKMGNIDIGKSMEYFEANGGHCDCEILFNVA